MAVHNNTGRQGEKLAAAWLRQHGYEVMHTNWRYSYYEIDIIAEKNKLLHFIEVKCRSRTSYGFPEESVGKKKFRRLQEAADQYLFLHPGHRWIQFDIVAIVLNKAEPDFFLMEDVAMY